ncbi:hypothetical protein C3L50_10410 [Flavobacterium alvei]|uniref:Secretion system C-terminal sorting domain-containing protein n=1 Tax=Flavobacterium alvei TaxID=2080416 RepID=A0A2S5AAF0_9FLAO|nr:T9SS type A sorting domain-containing protein [Flavobacterium alvei]POY39571.1 hypothetical protein C3L50_10410 [Flavobacterium alvei]
MKNKIQLLQFVAILIFSFGSYAQVTVSASNLQYTNNGQSTITLANCGNIDLASSTTTSINLGINLSKPNGQVVGLSDLRVYTKKSSSDSRIERSWSQILESSWNTQVNPNTRSTSASFSINSSDFNASGGTLYVVFKSSGNIEYTSTCVFTITKALVPSFTFSPTSLGLACGDTSSQTFTVTPANIPSGATVTYQWSYSGSWSGTVNSSMNSVTLTPNSVISLPSTVSVKPYVDNSGYPIMACAVSRSPIASSGSISGNTTVCTTGTYTFSGLLANQSVNWSLSNATAGTLSPTSGTSTTFTTTAGGATDIIATVTNSCGEHYTKSLSLFAGLPQAFSLVRASNEYCDDIKYHYVPYEIPNRNPLITYTYNVTPIPWVKVTQTSQTYNGVIQDVLVFPKTYSGTIDIYVTTTNSCGTTPFFVEEEPISNCSGLGLRLSSTAEQFTVFPNPADDIVTIELKDSEKQFEKDVTISGELFDMLGQSKSKIKISDNKATFSVKGLKKGIYVLKILINDQVESHRIAVE